MGVNAISPIYGGCGWHFSAALKNFITTKALHVGAVNRNEIFLTTRLDMTIAVST